MTQPSSAHTTVTHQPFLHDLVGVFHAPFQAWSRSDGSMGTTDGAGPIVADGIYLGDTRVLSDLHIEVEGAVLAPLPPLVRSAHEVELRHALILPESVVDPLVELHRVRRAASSGFSEEITLVSADERALAVRIRLALRPDVTGMSAVKDPRVDGHRHRRMPEVLLDDGGRAASWPLTAERPQARLRITGTAPGVEAAALSTGAGRLLLEAEMAIPAGGGSASLTWAVDGEDPRLPFASPASPWSAPILERLAHKEAGPGVVGAQHGPQKTADPQQAAVSRLLRRSLDDLDSLQMRVPGVEDESFFAAGAPWYFTLFGRDSLIAASLVLPLDVDIAGDTLRTLARRQGTTVDVETAEQPGKILHEVRGEGLDMGESYLPPVYYGTIDATPLWIELLHDAWRAGLPEAQVAALLPHLEAAATWLLEHGDADGDGFLEYIDESGHGLANQGWKDSGDSVRFADGTIAEGTIALAEVQGYAYAAARHAADLLESVDPGTSAQEEDHPGRHDPELPERLRAWAQQLRTRFHDAFWCSDDRGPYVALALDGRKQRVDGVASNMGHLLGTGLLDAQQERQVVDRLLDPTMFSGYGVRTLSTDNGAYWPLRYHGGSVWTHDTAYILRGMLRAGFEQEAGVLARGLLRAADGFDDRLPELFSGESAQTAVVPMPYPASCRPQAWAAASAVPVAQALGGI